MASYVSGNVAKGIAPGVWFPAQERAVNIRTSEVYEGPDREAVKFIKQETGNEHGTIGTPAIELPENIELAQQRNMSVEQFLRMDKPVTEAQRKADHAKATTVVTHTPAPRKQGVRPSDGGFGDMPK